MALVRAITGIATKTGAIPVGTEVDASDPIVVACPQFFAPINPTVEQATAAPGEKRTAPAKKAAAKKAAAKKAATRDRT